MADITSPPGGTRAARQILVWMIAAAIPLILLAPAFWNGYPLLQSDTGGYLARWYEGYLVPSRSTVFGLYLHTGEGSSFWPNLAIQALVANASAVEVDSDIRAAIALADFTDIGPQELRAVWDVRVEVAGRTKPALVCTWLTQVSY